MPTIHELKCFGLQAGGGNAALVIMDGSPEDRSDVAGRQRFATARNRPACVFIDAAPANASGAGFVLDYYYPHARSPLCLHATLAAAHVLLAGVTAPADLVVQTAMRGQRLTLSKRADGWFIRLARQPAPAPALETGLAALLLASPGIALASAPLVVSAGSPKLLLEVADSATLQALAPDLERITAWGQQHGVNGCYVYAQLPGGACEGRNFNHREPAMEDSATGVAAAALTLHLGRGLTLYQGAARGQPCRLNTQLTADGDVLLGGAVEPISTWKEMP